jgi:hypothetical protein
MKRNMETVGSPTVSSLGYHAWRLLGCVYKLLKSLDRGSDQSCLSKLKPMQPKMDEGHRSHSRVSCSEQQRHELLAAKQKT